MNKLLRILAVLGLLGSMTLTLLPTKVKAAGWWQPTPSAPIHWQWQIGDDFTYPTDLITNVTVYDVDGFSTSQATVTALHALGYKVIAYFSFGTYEDWRPDAGDFPSGVKGNSNGWAGENWLDITSATVKSIMSARIDLAVSKGFDAIEPDNIDGYSNDTGFSLTSGDQLTYNEWIATTVHAAGMSVGLKNDIEQVPTLEPYFDWCLNEESYTYDEYANLSDFVNDNKAVFEVEYTSSDPQAATMNALHINSMTRDIDLTAPSNGAYKRIPCIPDTQNTWTEGTTTTTTTTTTSAGTKPSVTTGSASSITVNSANVGESVTDVGTENVTAWGTDWGTSTSYSGTPVSNSGNEDAAFDWNDALSGLSAATKYHYRVYATNSVGTTNGSDATFLTLPNAPSSLNPTEEDTQVGFTWSKASGGSGTTIYTQIQYSSVSYPTDYTDGTTGVAWTTGTIGTVTGLTNDTLYYFRAFTKAVNGALTQYSTAYASTTAVPTGSTTTTETTTASPTIASIAINSATYSTTSATLSGNITSTGGDNPTVTIYWDTTNRNHGTWANGDTPDSPAQPQGVGAFTYDVTGLTPNTTYYFIAKAVNSAGTSYPVASKSFHTLTTTTTTTSTTTTVPITTRSTPEENQRNVINWIPLIFAAGIALTIIQMARSTDQSNMIVIVIMAAILITIGLLMLKQINLAISL